MCQKCFHPLGMEKIDDIVKKEFELRQLSGGALRTEAPGPAAADVHTFPDPVNEVTISRRWLGVVGCLVAVSMRMWTMTGLLNLWWLGVITIAHNRLRVSFSTDCRRPRPLTTRCARSRRVPR